MTKDNPFPGRIEAMIVASVALWEQTPCSGDPAQSCGPGSGSTLYGDIGRAAAR
jgi:hypothetical protein